MRGINARRKAAFRPKTTVANPAAQPAPNLLRGAPEPVWPGEVYVGDITYIATREGWLYMSAQGYCYDNAKAESFFATLKPEAFPDDCCFDTKAGARPAIFDYLESFYNRRRRHSSLGNISPDEFLD